jgi:hypothetical protein
MTWLSEAIRENKTGLASSTRIVMLAAGLTLCSCTLLLTVGSFWRIELVPALTVFGSALATMAGGAYVTNRIAERPKNDA